MDATISYSLTDRAMDFIVANRKKALVVLCAVSAMILCASVMAYTQPTAGDSGFEVYDFIFNTLLGGPIGFAICGIFIMLALFTVKASWVGAVIFAVTGAVLLKLEDLVLSFGMMIPQVPGITG